MSNPVQKSTFSAPLNDPLNTPIRANKAGLEDTFQKMIQAMIMQSFLPGMGEDSGQGAGALPMASMMMSLMEQLLSLKTEGSDAEAADAAGAAETAGAAFNSSLGGVFGTGDPEVGGGILAGFGMGRPLDPSIPSGKPVEGRLTQEAHPGHMALDLAVPIGTPVRSTMQGRVVYAGWNNEGYGNLVVVENGPYRTYYAHLSEIPVVIGQDVEYGSVIGQSGSTGNSTGPHLHYEIRKNMVQLDPAGATFHPESGSLNA